ncbi:MAG TPA: NAD(P)/FAD-dependent oxidoreductase [Longimicrobium sp.]|nr:NAD(P)/FAD-dependent oxidoreductase [Longimicrobium sp.]
MAGTVTATVPHVVVVGGGFGGLWAARALRRAPVSVTLVDRRNHHVFQPLLYQVATAALSPADIAAPIRGILRRDRATEVLLAEVTGFDLDARRVLLRERHALAYDYLIVATGATHAYFGHPEWEPLAPGLKTIEDATEVRRRFLLAFEAAEQEDDPVERGALLTFVIIGGGPTGVEMAGAWAEIARHALLRDFRSIDPSTARIILLEGGPRLLPAYPEQLSAFTERALRRVGVEVRTGAMVTHIDESAVHVGNERIHTHNVVWAAGITASPLGRALGAETDRVGRVKVRPDLSLPDRPQVFVVGDLAVLDGPDGKPLPGVAQVAMQGGQCAARNIIRTLRGEARRPFRYRNKGNMAVIGRRAAVLDAPWARAKGWIAWVLWLTIHLLFLVGFRNRIAVMMEWAWNYLTWQRGARLITGEVTPELVPHSGHRHGPDGPSRRDAEKAEAQGQGVPADTESEGWMGGDAHQAGGGAG